MDRKTKQEWSELILGDIEKIEKIYADPRIKGYIRDVHEKFIYTCIETYLGEDKTLKNFALDYFSQKKEEGERKRIKGIEEHMRSLEGVLDKKTISSKAKKKIISHLEEKIVSQIPKDIQEIYLKVVERYKMINGFEKKE